MRRLSKHGSRDKYDGHMPNKAHWVHDDYYVSYYQECFHISTAWGYMEGRRSGFSMGVDKKFWKASGYGIKIDSQHIGKSDNS